MLRLTRIETPGTPPTIRLEGKLLTDWIPELLGLSHRPGDAGYSVWLDLSGLTYADDAGASVLKELIAQGVTVTALSPFIAELLGLEKSQ
jgi:hypothetical protein